MFHWLRKLFRINHPQIRNANTTSKTMGGKPGSTNATTHQESHPHPSHEEQKPVLVRGKLWKNTEETRWDIPEKTEAVHDSSIGDLINRLARVERAETRRSAAESLGQFGQAAVPAIPALMQSAVDGDATVRKAALDALEAIDPAWPENIEARKAFPAIVTSLKSWSQDVSKAAFRLLNLIGTPAVPDLADALLNQDDTVDKVYVMQILAQIGPDAIGAVPGLIRMLKSQFIQSRIAAAEALANIGSAAGGAVPALMAGLSDSYADGRQAMATCLAQIGAASEPAMPALLPLLADRHDKVRKAAAEALEQIGPKVIPSLIEVIQTRDVQRLKRWMESMSKVSQWHTSSSSKIIADVHDVLGNLSWTVYEILEEQASLEYAQESALGILGKLGSASSIAVPAIIQALNDPNSLIKTAAIQALGKIGDTRALGPVQVIYNDKTQITIIRETAKTALQQIVSNKQSLPTD